MEQETKLYEVKLPLHTHFNTPDVNKRVFSKDAFEKALEKANEVYKNDGGIPVVLPYPAGKSINEFMFVDPTRMVGRVSDIDTESMTGNLKLNPVNENPKYIITEIENGMKLSLGLRGVGSGRLENGNMICDIDRIISFEIIDAAKNPCEGCNIIIKDPDNNEIIKRMVAELRKQCENNAYSFMGNDQKEIRRQYEETLQKCAMDWNNMHPCKEVELKLIYNEEKCDNHTISANISISGPGAQEFKMYLDEENNIK